MDPGLQEGHHSSRNRGAPDGMIPKWTVSTTLTILRRHPGLPYTLILSRRERSVAGLLQAVGFATNLIGRDSCVDLIQDP